MIHQITILDLFFALMGMHFLTGYEIVQHDFHEMLNNLGAINAFGVEYLANIPFE